MDGLHKFDLALMAAPPSPARQLVAAVSDGESVLFTGQAGTADCLRVLGRMLGRTRTRVLHVRPPLGLTSFMEQVASVLPVPGQCALEQGFESLTALDASCDRISLLVEDAHLLPHPTLRYIEMALRAAPHLQVVLAGQSALTETLGLAGFAGLRQRLSVRVDVTEPRHTPLPAVVVPIIEADVRRSRRPAVLAGALAASVAIVAWSLQAFVTSPALPLAVVTGEAVTASSSEASSPALAEPPAIPEPVAPVIVAQVPEAVPVPALTAEAPLTVSVPDLEPTPEPAAPIVVTQVPEAPVPLPAEMQPPIPDVAPGPALTADAPPSMPIPDVAPNPDPAPPVVVAVVPQAPAPVLPQALPAPLQTTPRAAVSPVLPRQVLMRSAPVRPERVASPAPAPIQNERRCRDIVLRAQLGEAPNDGDRTFMRNGCR